MQKLRIFLYCLVHYKSLPDSEYKGVEHSGFY